MKRYVFIGLCLLLFSGCSTSNFVSKPENAQINIGKTNISGTAPLNGRIPRTTFGKYPVKVQKDGVAPLYGILPLHVSPAAIGLDVLIFAPATFWNVQRPFSFYEFDLEKRVIRYRDTEEEAWNEYLIREAEEARAKQFFWEELRNNPISPVSSQE